MPAEYTFHTRFVSSLSEVSAGSWNALAGDSYPFLRHAFLQALETSECTTAATGWAPHHLLVYANASENNLIAFLPLYQKTNSCGEYVFDWSWADAYRQNSLEYYPKLLSAIPFTPSAGPRLCVDDGVDEAEFLPFVVGALKKEALRLNASGWHLLFPEKEISDHLHDLECYQRLGCQYQWFNRGYKDFNDFLACFTSRKRKNIRKERENVTARGITFEQLRGENITPEHWQQFYLFYESTYFVRGRNPYLSLDFFQTLGSTMPDALLLILAIHDGKPIAGALSLIGEDSLYGRYWGCSQEYQFLHFETCYYQGIDFCIANQLRRFDSGAQGEHKIQRGFEPVPTWSNHWLAHEGFHQAIDKFLSEEEQQLKSYINHAGNFLPFKQTSASE